MLRDLVAFLGAQFIYLLIWLFGRRRTAADIPWLVGPLGGDHIGDSSYEETAAAEGLALERHASAGGLIPRFDVLHSSSFDAARVHPKIRDFYENTAAYRFDTWAKTYFPANLALWLLVTTLSRKVDQLNFPLDGLATAEGLSSEIILLREANREIRYTGWFRTLQSTGRSLFTGFYMTALAPLAPGRCVKVVFPMPQGNATVILRPENDEGTGLRLSSQGRAEGDAGFYRVQRAGTGFRVWRIAGLHELFHLYPDDDGLVRCVHAVRFLGLPVLTLHYRIAPKAAA